MARARKASLEDLPAEWAEELSDASLRDTAGLKTFERGQEYLRSDRVELVRAQGLQAQFEAHGTGLYRVDLHFEDPGLHADCTCPHAADGNFCKHMVAAALLWRVHLGGEPDTPAAPSVGAELTQARVAKAAQMRAAKREALQAFLVRQPAEQLAQRLWERAATDRDLMAELKAWAATAGAEGDPKALRTAVDELLKVSSRDYLETREVRAWIGRALKAVVLLRDALPGLAAEVRAIAEHALQRAAGVQERAGDDPGAVDEVNSALMGVFIEALRAAPPPAAWAEHLLQRVQGDEGYLWSRPEVLDAAGPEVTRAYSRRLAELWALTQAKSRPEDAATTADLGFSGRPRSFDVQRDRLRRLMVEDLERQGDPLAVFEFMKRSALGLGEHAAVIRWCEVHGRPRDALQLAQAACKLFDNHAVVEDLLLQAYERDGWDEEALAIRRRRFDKQPWPDHYLALIKAATAARADLPAVRRAAYARVQAHEEAEARQRSHPLLRPGLRQASTGHNVTWRAGMLVLDNEIDQALALVQAPNGCDPRVLEALADRLTSERDADAFSLLKRCFEHHMAGASSPYKEPLRLVAKAAQRLDAEGARAFLLSIGAQHKAKRNFIAGLPRVGP